MHDSCTNGAISSILLTDERWLPTFFNDFLQVCCIEKAYDIDYYNHKVQIYNTNLFDSARTPLPSNLIETNIHSIFDLVKYYISKDYYCYTYINADYFSKWESQGQDKYDREVVIYGFDDSESILYIMGMDAKNLFSFETISYKDFLTGWQNIINESLYILYIHPKESYTEDFDTVKFKNNLHDYIFSIRGDENRLYGIETFRNLETLLQDTFQHNNGLYLKMYVFLSNHKNLMLRRIGWLVDHGILNENEYAKYERVEHKAHDLLKTCQKYNECLEMDILHDVRQKLHDLLDDEYSTLQSIYQILRNQKI